MSTIICMKEGNSLILATDSRFMAHDFGGVASDAEQKIFEIAPQVFLAPSGWKVVCDFQLAQARELVGTLGTSDLRTMADALASESIPLLEALVEVLRSIEHPHHKILAALDGKAMMHVHVLAGRTARGELGYINQAFRLQAGRVVCETQEYFGSERRLYVSSGDPANQLVEEDSTILDGLPIEVVCKFLAGLKRVWPTIGGANQIVRIDGSGALWISPPPGHAAIAAGHGLEVADALFAGDATFARSGGGKVTINSVGIALGDNNYSPNSTVTVTATGATIARGSNTVQATAYGIQIQDATGSSVVVNSTGATFTKGSNQFQVNATGWQISDSSGGTVTAGSGGIVIQRGSSSVTVAATGVTIVNGILTSPTVTVNGGGFTVNLDTTNGIKVTGSGVTTVLSNVGTSNGVAGVTCTNTSGDVSAICGGTIFTIRSTGQTSYLSGLSLSVNGGLAEIQSNELKITYLPSSNPGTGSKQFWYDTSDGNRVKYTP